MCRDLARNLDSLRALQKQYLYRTDSEHRKFFHMFVPPNIAAVIHPRIRVPATRHGADTLSKHLASPPTATGGQYSGKPLSPRTQTKDVPGTSTSASPW